MNPYSFATYLFAFGSFFVGFLVWFKRNDAVGRIYFIFSTFIVIWALGFAIMMMKDTSYEAALLGARVADGAALFIPACWIHVIALICGETQRKKRLILSLYVLGAVTLCFAFTPLFIPTVKPVMNFRYWLNPGPVFHIFTVMFFIAIPYGFKLLFQKIKRSVGQERFQLQGFFAASLIGFIGGTITFAPNYGILIPHGIFF